MEMLQGVWKQHLRPRAVVGYGVKIFLPNPPNYVTRSPGRYLCNKQNNTCLLEDMEFLLSFSTRYLTRMLRPLVRLGVEQ